ncbi:MAG: hypothetical protein ACLFVJ_12435 [Persicimonas sp.]
MNTVSWTALGLMAAAALACATACEDAGPERDRSPLYRWGAEDQPSSGERGNLLITEINFAGSVTDDGTRDADDIFIELQNKHPRPINPSGWHLAVEGDVNKSWRIPRIEEPIQPNDYFVIARKKDGAFADIARERGTFIEDFELGSRRVSIELRDFDLRLMEQVGSEDNEVFSGGWDTVSVRTMERAELIFGNQGGDARNWHAYSEPEGFSTVAEGWRKYTLASPGAANSADYSGSSTSGNFE